MTSEPDVRTPDVRTPELISCPCSDCTTANINLMAHLRANKMRICEPENFRFAYSPTASMHIHLLTNKGEVFCNEPLIINRKIIKTQKGWLWEFFNSEDLLRLITKFIANPLEKTNAICGAVYHKATIDKVVKKIRNVINRIKLLNENIDEIIAMFGTHDLISDDFKRFKDEICSLVQFLISMKPKLVSVKWYIILYAYSFTHLLNYRLKAEVLNIRITTIWDTKSYRKYDPKHEREDMTATGNYLVIPELNTHIIQMINEQKIKMQSMFDEFCAKFSLYT